MDIGEYVELTGYKICDNMADYPKEEGMKNMGAEQFEE